MYTNPYPLPYTCVRIIATPPPPQEITSMIGRVRQAQCPPLFLVFLAFCLSHARFSLPHPTSLLKPIPSQFLLNVNLSPGSAGSVQAITGPIRSVLVRTNRQPWSRMTLLFVNSQTRLQGGCDCGI